MNSETIKENNDENDSIFFTKSKLDEHFWKPFQDQYKLERVDGKSGRKYQVRLADGQSFSLPSITTVLSQTGDKSFLEKWRKRVGYEEAARITKRAASRGTKLHGLLEDYLRTNEFPKDKQLSKIKTIIDTRIGNVLLCEQYLFSNKLGCAGTVDCIGYFDGILSVIDWKTSTKEKEENWILDYFLQETSYSIMFSEITGMKVSQIVTIIKIDGDPTPQVFIKKPKDYIKPLMQRIKLYQMGLN